METFSNEAGIITRIEDFFPYLQYIVTNLIEGNLQELADTGYARIEVLKTMVSYRREVHCLKTGQAERNLTPGLPWLKVPPDHAIEAALDVSKLIALALIHPAMSTANLSTPRVWI